MTETADVHRKILEANEREANLLHERFTKSHTLVVNLVSSPGAGKTSLLEQTLIELGDRFAMAVLVGDIATERDADRIRKLGVPAYQIITGGACHLDARLVSEGLEKADFGRLDILFIENVGNLVCPASYDLGEDFKVAMLSVTEGDDKPFKYPAIFSKADVTLLTKADLLPHVWFDLPVVREQVTALRPTGRFLVTSSRTGEGIPEWSCLLEDRLAAKLGVTV
jgi:hydrogenase nickel incorporation protein HypB